MTQTGRSPKAADGRLEAASWPWRVAADPHTAVVERLSDRCL